MDNLWKQPLEAAALGEAAALSFTVQVFPPYKSNQGVKIKGKKQKAGRGTLEAAVGGERAHSGCLSAGNFLIWMEAQSIHFKMIL